MNRKGYNEVLKEHWKDIMDTNFQEVIAAILGDLGFGDDMVNGLATDKAIKREMSDEELQDFNIQKKSLIERWKTTIDEVKEARIAEIFVV